MTHPRVKWLLDKVQGSRILDIGCARKDDILHEGFKERNPQSLVVGIDLDEISIREMLSGNNVLGTALHLPFPNSTFDAVIMGEVLEHEWDGFALLCEVARVSSEGALIYVTTPNPFSPNRWLRYWMLARRPYEASSYQSYLGTPEHKMLWTPSSLLKAFAELGFDIVEFVTIGVRVPFVARFIESLGALNIQCYPFSRLGGNICVIGQKKGTQ